MLDRLLLTARLLPLLPKLVAYRPESKSTVADLFERQASRRRSQPLVLHEERSASYAELDARANRVAHWARQAGLHTGDVAALLMENRPEYLATWLGLAKLGVTTALINTNLSGRGLRHALATSGARYLVLGSECLDRFATTAHDLESPLQVVVDPDPEAGDAATALPEGAEDFGRILADQPATRPDPALRADLIAGDDLFYIYTSGTTGLPKAARFSHMRFLGIGDLCRFALDMHPEDVHYCALPLYHSAGGAMLVSCVFHAGATIAMRRKFSASSFWDDIRRYDATHFQYIGEFCRYLMNQPPRPDDRDHQVRAIIGNGLRPDIWEEFQERFGIPAIREFYGATEGNTAIINLENKVGSVGRFPFKAATNARLIRYDVIADTHPRNAQGFCIECTPNEVGELVGRIPASGSGSGRYEGYTSKEATDKKVLRDVLDRGDAYFRTGDLLRQDSNGFFYFVDRIGDTFRWKGENVSTQEVAELLSGFPGLEMVNVYGVEVPGADGRAGMAALVFGGGARFEPDAFFRHVEEHLPRYAAPIFVRLLTEQEITGTFKIRKVELVREGFDPGVVSDDLYLRDEKAGTYVPLTRELFEAIHSGERPV